MTNTKKFTVLVEDDCVTETISKDYFHYPRCIGDHVSICDGFHCCKCAHAAACHEIMVSVDVKDLYRGFDWEAVNELAGTTVGGVCKCTSRAGITHVSDISVHPRPVEL